MGSVLSVILDLLVVVCLGVTIFYAHRLSNSLNVFRKTRQEFTAILRELSRNIDEAQAAVEGLKRASKESGQTVQKSLNESKDMANELEIINEASRKLAERLERLAGHNMRFAQGLEDEGYLEEVVPDQPSRPSFAIFDRELEQEEEEELDVSPPEEGFQSQAERDLFEALKRGKPRRAG